MPSRPARSFGRSSASGSVADDIGVGSDTASARTGPNARSQRPIAIYGSFRYGQYFEDLLAGVVSAAEAAGSSVISVQASDGVLPSAFEVDGQEMVSRAGWDHFDGAIVVLQAVSTEFVASLRAAGKFLVAIGPDLRGTHAAITIDNTDGVRQAVAHLAEHGHIAIGFLSPTWQVDTAERYAAYCAQLADLGLAALPLLGAELPPKLSMDEQGYRAARRFATADRPCTAVLAGTDRIALGFLRGLREAGVRVPDDVALVGIDDVAEAAVSSPPLATVAISFERVGETAFDVALRGSRGEPTQAKYVVPERFVPRESCGCPGNSGRQATRGTSSPVDVFIRELTEATQDGAFGRPADPESVTALAHEIIALLDHPAADRTDRKVLAALATRVNDLCTLDRSVQAALRAIRALAESLARSLPHQDAACTWAVSAAALDLCDAIRSGQLQRRMAEYVDLKRMQVSHYFIGNNLLSHDRDELRSLTWLQQTPAQAGALGLWHPVGKTDRLAVHGGYERLAPGAHPNDLSTGEIVPVEAFPPARLLQDSGATGRLVVITQVRFEGSDWGLLAVAGGRILQSSLVQETFQQWSILMSTALDAERADADLARQALELKTAYETEMALINEVRVSEERYALAAEAAQDALWDWDIASGTVFYSNRWKALLGHRDHEVGTSPDEWLGRIHPDDEPTVRAALDRALLGAQQNVDVEHRLRMAGGEYRWIGCSGRSVLDDAGRPTRLVGSVTDVTVRRLLQEQLVQEARFDALTGLAKRPLFMERLGQAFERAKHEPDYQFAVLFMDLNGFKEINDTLGHAAGDDLLTSVAKRMKESLRRNDMAARLGGDEFVILISDVDHHSELPLIIERLEALVRSPHEVGGQSVTVDAALGVSFSGRGQDSPEAVLHEADSAMYRAKRRSRIRR